MKDVHQLLSVMEQLYFRVHAEAAVANYFLGRAFLFGYNYREWLANEDTENEERFLDSNNDEINSPAGYEKQQTPKQRFFDNARAAMLFSARAETEASAFEPWERKWMLPCTPEVWAKDVISKFKPREAPPEDRLRRIAERRGKTIEQMQRKLDIRKKRDERNVARQVDAAPFVLAEFQSLDYHSYTGVEPSLENPSAFGESPDREFHKDPVVHFCEIEHVFTESVLEKAVDKILTRLQQRLEWAENNALDSGSDYEALQHEATMDLILDDIKRIESLT